MNIIEELEDIFSLAENDEKFALKRCIESIQRVHSVRERMDDKHIDLDELREKYEHHQEWIPREDWPRDVLSYEAYAVKSNVNASGGCAPGTMRPIGLEEPEDWGLADVYPLAEVEE